MHPCEEAPRAIYPSEDGCYNVLSDRRQALIYMPHLHAIIFPRFLPLSFFIIFSVTESWFALRRCSTACSAWATASSAPRAHSQTLNFAAREIS
jgi:hypothetical protein